MIDFIKIKEKIKRSPVWKMRIHRALFSNSRPRLWVKWFVNPLVFRHGKGALTRRRTIMNVSPINHFYIGTGSTIEEFTVVDNGVGDVLIGNETRIGIRSTLIGPVEIGNHVILAQNIVVSGLNHRYKIPETPIHQQGVDTATIRIGDDSWIGANSVITAGVSIGKHVIVGAGSVVLKDIPDYCVAVGNPARIIRKLDTLSGEWVSTK